MAIKSDDILDILEIQFPNAHCELNYHDLYELLCAVILSAQTTDISVNKVTPNLFKKYPDAFAMSKAKLSDVEKIIRSIGLYRNKAHNLIEMAKSLVNNYEGNVPDKFDELVKLPGVGRKTANVIMAEGFKKPALAVDTHVERVSKRLGLVPIDKTVEETEMILKKKIKKERWSRAHHLLIFFGRYQCKSQKPICENCSFVSNCRYLKGKAK